MKINYLSKIGRNPKIKIKLNKQLVVIQLIQIIVVITAINKLNNNNNSGIKPLFQKFNLKKTKFKFN